MLKIISISIVKTPDFAKAIMSLFNPRKSRRTRNISYLQKKIMRYLRDIYAKDLLLNLEMEAMRESIAYIKQHMNNSMIFTNWHNLHAHAMEHVTLNGLYLEFGVKKGETIREIAAMTSNIVHGFDSFEGLPEDWTGTILLKGRFNKQGKLPGVPKNVILHAGWFNETLPTFKKLHPDPIAYMHIDCDLYSSTRTIFEHLADRIIPGTVIVFDEYFNYPNWQQHEYKAFQEFIHAHGITYEYLGFLSYDSCVAVKITSK